MSKKISAIVLAVTLSDINFRLGSVNPSGISDVIYFIPKEDLQGWPTVNDDFDDASNARDYSCYQGNFKAKEGKTWHRMYNTQGKGNIDWDYQGETDCKVVINKASFSYPKLTDEIRAFAKFATNGDFVFIAKHDAVYYVIGNKDYRATVTPNGNSGDAPGSAKGVTITVECTDTTPLPRYSGTLELEDGILDCSTDTFTPES